MPRQARLDVPGALHHIMVRGINKSAIFQDDQDKTRFLERLRQITIESKCAIYGILGSGEFVQAVLREAEERQLRQTRLRRRGKGIQDIIREESEKRRVNSEELMKGSRRRQVSKARVEIAARCKEELGLSGAEIAHHLGVNTTSINRALAKRERL
jgi:hypothetical protein